MQLRPKPLENHEGGDHFYDPRSSMIQTNTHQKTQTLDFNVGSNNGRPANANTHLTSPVYAGSIHHTQLRVTDLAT